MKTLLLSLLFVTVSANATQYYMNKGGTITKISASEFDGCAKVFYRKSGKKGLSGKHKKGVVKATLKGELLNDAGAVAKALSSHEGSCTHSADGESIK